jgi:hypothetical protein
MKGMSVLADDDVQFFVALVVFGWFFQFYYIPSCVMCAATFMQVIQKVYSTFW